MNFRGALQAFTLKLEYELIYNLEGSSPTKQIQSNDILIPVDEGSISDEDSEPDPVSCIKTSMVKIKYSELSVTCH